MKKKILVLFVSLLMLPLTNALCLDSDADGYSIGCLECKGGVDYLKLRNDGPSGNIIAYDTKSDDPAKILFEGYVANGAEFDFYPRSGRSKFSRDISVWVNGVSNAEIHTSCSRPIGPGLVKGEFTITEGSSVDNGDTCPLGDCLECRGGITELTFNYTGSSGVVLMIRSDDSPTGGDLIYSATLNNGDIFTVTDLKLYPNDKYLFLDGVLLTDPNLRDNKKLHTSCSDPNVAPGMTFGDFEITSAKSKDNGEICPLSGGDCGEEDCDDMDDTIYPSAQELCDGKDNDCDGQIDEGCSECGNGIIEDGEECDDGNNIGGDGCSAACLIEKDICDPDAELVGNGNFEQPTVTDPIGWDIFPDGAPNIIWNIEWQANQTSYNSYQRPDPLLEIQAGVNGWLIAEGSQYAELDADWDGPGGSLTGEPASVKIYQDLATIPGETYRLRFLFSPRPDTTSNNNILEVRWNNVLQDTIQAAGLSDNSWTEFEYNLTADSSLTRLQFADLGSSDSLGTFIDNISLRCTPPYDPCEGNIAPQLNITHPYPKFTLANPLDIEWDFYDPDGPNTTMIYLFYSQDNGITWHLLTAQQADQGDPTPGKGAYSWGTSAIDPLIQLEILGILYDGCNASSPGDAADEARKNIPTDQFDIVGSEPIPEFSDYGLIASILIIIGTYAYMKKRKTSKTPKKRKKR